MTKRFFIRSLIVLVFSLVLVSHAEAQSFNTNTFLKTNENGASANSSFVNPTELVASALDSVGNLFSNLSLFVYGSVNNVVQTFVPHSKPLAIHPAPALTDDFSPDQNVQDVPPGDSPTAPAPTFATPPSDTAPSPAPTPSYISNSQLAFVGNNYATLEQLNAGFTALKTELLADIADSTTKNSGGIDPGQLDHIYSSLGNAVYNLQSGGSFDSTIVTNSTVSGDFSGSVEASTLSVSGQTELDGGLILGTGTTTASNGINISSGCFAVNNTCVGGGGSGSGTVNSGTFGQVAFFGANGTAVSGTSTLVIGTTTADANHVGIGTTSPYSMLSVAGQVVGQNFVAASITATSTFAGSLTVSGGYGTYGSDPYGALIQLIADTNTATHRAAICSGNGNQSDMGVEGCLKFAVGNNPVVQLDTGDSNDFWLNTDGQIHFFENGAGLGLGSGFNLTSTGDSLGNQISEAEFGTTTAIGNFVIQATSTSSAIPMFTVASSTGASVLTVTRTGSVGVGTSTPASKFTVVGSACISGGTGATAACTSTAGHISAVSHDTAAVDVAENYKTQDQTISAGDVVSIDQNNRESIVKAASGSLIIGIISTQPGVLLGSAEDKTLRPVALAGRVPVKVSMENGAIKIGDDLTISSTPGIAMKATKSSQPVIATALDNALSNGTVVAFVRSGASESLAVSSDSLASSTATIQQSLLDSLTNWIGQTITAVEGFFTHLTVGTSAQPSGITLYDSVSGQPYCLKVTNGAPVSTQGACTDSSLQTQNQSSGGGTTSGGGSTDESNATTTPPDNSQTSSTSPSTDTNTGSDTQSTPDTSTPPTVDSPDSTPPAPATPPSDTSTPTQ